MRLIYVIMRFNLFFFSYMLNQTNFLIIKPVFVNGAVMLRNALWETG